MEHLTGEQRSELKALLNEYRVMINALGDYSEFCCAYLDDIAVYTEEWNDHLIKLRKVLQRIRELNISLNAEKCFFGQPEVRFLGHVVGSGKHAADPEKIEAIRNLELPKTKKGIRSFLGLCNFYREYVKGYADIARPLTDLTRKRAPNEVNWGEKEIRAFQLLKERLAQAPSLCTPILGRPFVLHTDASEIGVGACLSQEDDQGRLFPCAFASAKLTNAQRAWSSIEREAYAVKWALEKFSTWLFGAKIKLFTDHCPLTFLKQNATHSSRLQRWSFSISRYDLELEYCRGSQLPHADALSRLDSASWADQTINSSLAAGQPADKTERPSPK